MPLGVWHDSLVRRNDLQQKKFVSFYYVPNLTNLCMCAPAGVKGYSYTGVAWQVSPMNCAATIHWLCIPYILCHEDETFSHVVLGVRKRLLLRKGFYQLAIDNIIVSDDGVPL